MKVGILTFHRAHNYGAVLQCYALQEVLKGMGHDVEVIDYRQPWIEGSYKVFSPIVLWSLRKSLKKMLMYIYGHLKQYKSIEQRTKIFQNFINGYLKISKRYFPQKIADYDACIVGSDQLWGLACFNGYIDNVYLGNFNIKNGGKKIGYAISSNNISIDYLIRENRLFSSLNNFNCISFRESEIVDKIKKYSNQKINHCIDPTLLTDKNCWLKLQKGDWSKKKYVVSYEVRRVKNNFSVLETARLLANKLDCELVNLNTDICDVCDFVSAIANAHYVVTSSFHATVFALLYNRRLATYLLHDGLDSRYKELLEKVGGTCMIYEVGTEPLTDIIINWERINQSMEQLKKDSVLFLEYALNN